jgi:hypothetical protein
LSTSGVSLNCAISCVPPENSTPYFRCPVAIQKMPAPIRSAESATKYYALPRKSICGFLMISMARP